MLFKNEANMFPSISEGAFIENNFNTLLFKAIEKRYAYRVKELIDHAVQYNEPIDLLYLNSAISQADPEIIEHIIPHCGFSKPSDQYIPRELVIKSDKDYQNCVKLLLNWNFAVNPDSKNDEEFVYAAVENGYLPIVVQLLDHGVDVNMVNSDTELNLLTIACVKKHHEIVEVLLKHNADVNVIISGKNKKLNESVYLSRNLHEYTKMVSPGHNKDELYDVTCLHIAVFNSDAIITELSLKYGAKIISDPKFFYLAYLALKNKCKEIFDIFLEYGVNITDIDHQGTTFLHSCVHSDCDEDSKYSTAKWLLERGANIHLQTPNNTFVFDVITNKLRKIAQLFLDYNPDVQYISSDGNTALHEAIKNDFDVEFIKTLLQLSVPVNISNDVGLTPLHIACKIRTNKRLKIIKLLLHYNADVNCADNNLMTPLHAACDHRWREVVELLLKKGANPNAKNNEGKTPFHYVCKYKNSEAASIIRLLLRHKGNIEAMDTRGWTPLFIACENNNNAVVKLLLDKNAYANYKNLENSTPLHISVEGRCAKAIRSLIEYGGANIDILDNNNQTPLQFITGKLDFCRNQLTIYELNPKKRAYFENQIIIHKKIFDILLEHVVKLAVAGRTVNQRIIWTTNQGSTMSFTENNTIIFPQQNKESIEKQIAEMKITRFNNTNITFYDLLTQEIPFLSRFVKNKDILNTLKNKVYKKKFPSFINIIRGRYEKAKRRSILMKPARKCWLKNACKILPDECIDLILDNLSHNDLLALIGAKTPFNR